MQSHKALICRVTESFLKLSGLWVYKVFKKKAQLCHLPRCVLKGTDSLPKSWVNQPSPLFPTPPCHKSSLKLSQELQDFTESRSLKICSLQQTPFYAPPNIPIWVLNNVWPSISLRKLASNRLFLWLTTYLILTSSGNFSENRQARFYPTPKRAL
jgi:hypothetical protein